MTTLRSALLTLALLILLELTSLARNAPNGAFALAAPVQQASAGRYFVAMNGNAPAQPGEAAAPVRPLPSAVVNRRFADRGATLRRQMGGDTINPVSSAAILPNHAASRVIPLAAAQAQAPAVARARGIALATVLRLVNQHTERFAFGGETQVDLSMLNRALDEFE